MNPSIDITNTSLAEMLNDCSIDRIMAIDKDWCIIAWNTTAETISGISKPDIIGKKLLEVFPQYARDKEMMNALDLAFSGIKSFVPSHRELFNRQYYENHFIPLRDANGRLFGVMNIMHEVAHRIKAEQQLYQLNIALKKKYEQLERATDELSTITHITSHNIKEPLRQVYSSIELLIRAEAKAMSDGGKANLRRMQASLSRMNLLLDDILALTGINNPADEGAPVDLNVIAHQAINNLTDKITTNNAVVETAALPAITGHRDILYYLFFHLISNAVRFRKNDVPLKLIISSSEVAFPANGQGSSGDRFFTRISFKDNGTGFHQEDAERIFLMADKTPQKYATSGAGLAICRKIMMAHDGFIQAEGWPGNGAAFHCYFPGATDK